uniref:II-FBPL precursor n=1 Tax=Xenopus tropicalis TaxID=8364 RepID=F6U3M8_XENTR
MKCFVVLLVCISIGWVHSCKFRQEESNLIKGATAKQSSTSRPDYSAERAFDGISDYNMMRHPCAETRREHSPWWQLDLKHNYKVDSVVIVSRRDCCFHTLLGAQIRIGNSPDNNNPVCGIITDVFRPINLCCNGMEGRYVSVVIPGREEELTLCEVKVYGEDNIARLGEATQSSTYRPEYNAVTAIDGDRNPDMMAGSCSLTGNDNPAWWQLDLKKRYKVETVVIVNRGDCCWERLRGAVIRVGDSANNNNPVCDTIKVGSQGTITLCCEGLEGRYVSVVIPGREENLSLCEVEVYGQEAKAVEVNLARLGDVKQSSTYRPEYNAATAVDGNKNSNMMLGSCSHTNSDNPAWWQLDLKKRYQVEKVVIVNRGDCCGERLRGAEVRVGNSADNNNPVCGAITDASQATITLPCKGMKGRYVSVVIPGRNEYLTLCEVEVYGQEAKPDAVVNLAKSGRARQSSTYRPEYNAAAAIDGDKGTNIFQHPCSHTNPDNPAWWQLDLTKKYNIESVVIVNRGDCCSERLRGAEIRVGIFPFINSPVCDTVTDVSKPTITLNCNGMVGQYISVVIPGRQEYLTLCEVEVYGQEI